MRIDIDTYREILDTLTRNKSRSFLTGFGVFWGVFMLVFLIGGGNGLKELLYQNFEGFATNSAMIWSQNTTKPYKGFKKDRQWNMDLKDIERLHSNVPELDIVTALIFCGSREAVKGEYSFSANVQGIDSDYAKVSEPKLYYGRYINRQDVISSRKVCVIGKQVYKKLFPDGRNPCGERIRIDNNYYTVVGVDYRNTSMNIGGRADQTICLPQSVLRTTYNRGNSVDILAVTGAPGVVISDITPRIRATIARGHLIDPTDEKGIMVFNTEVLFGIMDSLFKGVNFLIWLIGIGTLLAGAIGVSNIMMVTMRERTVEIGIRRAIGATPRMILSQIISESILLTGVAGMSGIMFGVALLQMLELANTEDGILMAHFQIGFSTAVFAALLLSALGGAAGLAPAWRAMNIKPVDAMRDE